jgi:LysM repeat protein
MSFSNSSKVTAIQSDVNDLKSSADTMKAAASDVASLKQKVDSTAGKLDAVVNNLQTTLQDFGSKVSAQVTAINDKVDKLGTRATATASTGGSKSSAAAAETAVTSAGGTHAIVAGDTLANLAKKYNVTLTAIEAANPGVEPSTLKIGQVITIPPSKSSGGSAPAPRSSPTTTSTAPASGVAQ